jgi:endoglucanase
MSAPLYSSVPTPERLWLAAPDVIALSFQEGRLSGGRILPYQPDEGDRVESTEYGKAVYRDGKLLGYRRGSSDRWIYEDEAYVDGWTEPPPFDDASQWTLTGYSGENTEQLEVLAVYRKTKPSDMVIPLAWEVDFPKRHVVFLRAGKQAVSMDRIVLRLAGDEVGTLELDTRKLRSDSIQVSQAGYDLRSSRRHAVLSLWMGNGGAYPFDTPMPFELLDEDGRAVWTGEVELFKEADEPDDDFAGIKPEMAYNVALAPTYGLDFSSFTKPGVYRIHIPGIGVSFPFAVSDRIWEKAWKISMRGFYSQRAGLEMDLPWANYKRPIGFHPSVGKQARVSKARMNPYTIEEVLSDTHVIRDQKEAFTKLPKYATDEWVEDISGSYFDAGDWDRRSKHLIVPYRLLMLYALAPGHFKAMEWGLPGENPELPDLLEEVIWGMDLYRRLQHEDGGVPGWIESEEHPVLGEASWNDSLDLFVSAPDAITSYLFAACAYRLARALEPLQEGTASQWRQAAGKAISFAEQTVNNIPADHRWMNDLVDKRNLAALEAWLSTGDETWHDLFQQTTIVDGPETQLNKWYPQTEGGWQRQLDAAFLYVTQDLLPGKPLLAGDMRRSILDYASFALEFGRGNVYGFTKYDSQANAAWGTLGAPQASHLAMAWWLTGNHAYYDAAAAASFLALGMNGDQISFTTGLGSRTPNNPLIIDPRRMGVDAAPGISLYGLWDPANWSAWGIDRAKQADAFFPPYEEWPTGESYVDIGYGNAGQAEYTVQQTMIQANYVWGMLSIGGKEVLPPEGAEAGP